MKDKKANKESMDAQVMNAFAECLRTIYVELELKIPKEFHPRAEARKILKAMAAHRKPL